MAHRGQAHAARRRCSNPTPFRDVFHDVHTEDGTNAMVSREWDATTYDDVIPHRLRGTLVLNDDGEPAELTDLVADRRFA